MRHFVILKKYLAIKALEQCEPVTRYKILKTIARIESRNVQSIRNGSCNCLTAIEPDPGSPVTGISDG